MSANEMPGPPAWEQEEDGRSPQMRVWQDRWQDRRLRWAGAAAMLVLVAGAAAWLTSGAHDGSGGPSEVPLIQADSTPIKVRPDDPGGLQVAHRDKLVYQRLQEDGSPPVVEQLLPEPEEPLPPPEPPPADAEAGLPPVPPLTPEVDDGEAAASAMLDGEPEHGDATAWEEPGAEQPRSGAASADPAEAAGGGDDNAATARSDRLSPEARVAQALLMPSAASPQATAAAPYEIQLASVRSRAEAEVEWKRLQRRHPALLGSLEPAVSRADLGVRGVYFRLRAGPVDSRDRARQICRALTDANVGCIVVHASG